MEPFAAALAQTIRSGHEEIMDLARIRARQTGVALDDHDLEQLMNGFESLLLEALEERGTEARDLFIETTVPGVIAAGLRTPDQLAGGTAAWGVLLSTALLSRLPDDQRQPAAVWLAGFFGDYAEAAARAAREAS